MKSIKTRFTTQEPGSALTMHPMFWVLGLLSLVPLCVAVPLGPPKAGAAIIAIWIALLWVAISFARNQFHYVVPVWVAVYPYCYYLLSYPAERSIFTIDRALICLLLIEMFLASRRQAIPLTRDVQMSAYLWAAFLALCFLSLRGQNPTGILPSYRYLVDGMVMPAVLGLYAMRYFPVFKDLSLLHLCACILGLGLFLTGLIEVTTQIDLFPWNGSEPMYTDTHLRRADGPFEQQVILSVVGVLAFFFILYLGHALQGQLSRRRRFIHTIACLAALGAALLPLNRGLIFALLPVALIDCWSKERLVSRRLWAAFFSAIFIFMVGARVLSPRLYEDRVSDPSNVYQRLAQHEETLRVVRDYPLFGVGFGLYHDVAMRNPQYMSRWNGIESMNVPHNVLMTVLSEEGLVGLFVYLASQILLIRAMWKIRKAYPPGWLAFLYCTLVYIVIGLDYATVAFSDINLLYLFILGVIYQVQFRIATSQQVPAINRLETQAL